MIFINSFLRYVYTTFSFRLTATTTTTIIIIIIIIIITTVIRISRRCPITTSIRNSDDATQLLYSHLHHHSASQRHNIKDRRRNEGRMIKTHEGRHVKENAGSFFTTYLPLTLLQGFERLACERMLETERKLHILTPLL